MADSKEIFTYAAPWPVYGLSWSSRPSTFRLALSSFQQDCSNKLQVIQVFPGAEGFTTVVEAEHPFPVTKLKWSPYKVLPWAVVYTMDDMLKYWKLGRPGTRSLCDDGRLPKTLGICDWPRRHGQLFRLFRKASSHAGTHSARDSRKRSKERAGSLPSL